MSSLYFIGAGFCLIAFAVLVAANTSMGGTRSDYDDGSSFILSFGVLVSIVGFIGLVLQITGVVE